MLLFSETTKIYKFFLLILIMHYIKDVFKKQETEHAHNKFIRYSKGNFVGPIINIKVSKKI